MYDKTQIMKFLGKFVFFILIVLGIDFAVGNILRYLYFNQSSGLQYRTTYSMEETKQDIIILGPSTANHHYIPDIIEDSLNLSCYNAGRDGVGLNYYLAIQRSILRRYKPKLFIIDIRPSLISNEFQTRDRLSNLLPYYENHPEIRNIVEKKSRFERIKLLSKIYPYNSMLLVILNGIISDKNKTINGYIPLYKKLATNDQLQTLKETYTYNSDKLGVLSELIQNAKINNIDIIIVDSPSYNLALDSTYFELISNICEFNDVKYFSFLNDSRFTNHPEYFSDRGHLNNDGAILFTKLISMKLAEFKTNL